MKVSVFENLYSKTPFTQSVESLLERFSIDDRYGIGSMATLPKAQANERKKQLPVVCFGGLFKERKNSALIKASGLLVLDFDNVNIDETKAKLKEDKSCLACFASPSGKGVKALIRIATVKNDDEYKQYFAHAQKMYPELDESGKDISRACFFCFDEDLYYNDQAEVLEIELCKPETKKIAARVDAVKNDYAKASKACEIIRHAREGERHNKILKASRLLGGYVAAKQITFSEAERILLQEADLVNDDWKDNIKAVRDGLQNGMESPISVSELDKELKAEESLIKYGKIYYTIADKRAEVVELYENGQQRGYDIGINEIDDYTTCKLGTTTYVYGAPYSGKTQYWFWYLIRLSKRHGLRHAIFSPETGSAKEIFAELVQMTAQQDFYNTYNKQMSEAQRDEAMKFVDAHFIVIDPSHKVITHTDFFNYIDEIERVYNVKVHTATIDPFNEFRQDLSKYSNRQDLYLESVLSEVRENARTTNRHNCIITHVQDQQILIANGVRYYPIPTYREIAGGQAWSRKGMTMIAVWRPKEGLCDDDGVPYESNATIIDIQKSKPKGVGKLGKVKLLYNLNMHSYSPPSQAVPEISPVPENFVQARYNNNIDTSSIEPPF